MTLTCQTWYALYSIAHPFLPQECRLGIRLLSQGLPQLSGSKSALYPQTHQILSRTHQLPFVREFSKVDTYADNIYSRINRYISTRLNSAKFLQISWWNWLPLTKRTLDTPNDEFDPKYGISPLSLVFDMWLKDDCRSINFHHDEFFFSTVPSQGRFSFLIGQRQPDPLQAGLSLIFSIVWI